MTKINFVLCLFNVSLFTNVQGLSIFFFQIFKGKFHYCKGNDDVKNKTECERGGNNTSRWENRMYNFDNLPKVTRLI